MKAKFYPIIYVDTFEIESRGTVYIGSVKDTDNLTMKILYEIMDEQRIVWIGTKPHTVTGIERMGNTPAFGLLMKPIERFITPDKNIPIRLMTAKEAIEELYRHSTPD